MTLPSLPSSPGTPVSLMHALSVPRKLAQKYHPDNFPDENEKKEAEKKFLDIAAAKEVLTDPG